MGGMCNSANNCTYNIKGGYKMRVHWQNKKEHIAEYVLYAWVIFSSVVILVLALQLNALSDRIDRLQASVNDTRQYCDDALNCTFPLADKE
jgi:hypothetical protein